MAENNASNSAASASERGIEGDQSDKASSAQSEWDIPLVPEGFSSLRAPDGHIYLLPSFLIDQTCFAYHREDQRNKILPDTAAGGPHRHTGGKYQGIAEGLLEVPVDPPFTDREILSMHAEVKALQDHLGISYKDAAHRLHMAALERLKAERQIVTGLTLLRERADRTVFQEIYPPIMAIDRGDFDEELADMPSRAGNRRPQS